jgi:hypothetical protein
MKTVFNIVLTLCALALVYICYTSIVDPIKFEEEKNHREKAVIARLIDIRKAQAEYHMANKHGYTASFDTLIAFIKTAKRPVLFKVGELTDKQLEDGLTEKKAIAIINKAKQTGKFDEVVKNGLQNFRRDTMWVSVLDTVFGKNYAIDSLKYVPYGEGKTFEMEVRNDTAKSGAPVYMYEVRTPYEVYLGGMDHQEIVNLKDVQTKLGRYCGLMIGSIETPNNGAGNWE